jgi:hypothetical protein
MTMRARTLRGTEWETTEEISDERISYIIDETSAATSLEWSSGMSEGLDEENDTGKGMDAMLRVAGMMAEELG